MVDKKLKDQPNDENLFRQAVGDVVPLKSPPRTDSKAPRKSRPRQANRALQDTRPEAFEFADSPGNIDAEDGSSHRKNGVQKRVVQKLKRGQFAVMEQLDLHHMSTATAHDVLLDFIDGMTSPVPECVRIIHGKGLRSEAGPRLKIMTRKLLREHPRVLAFTDCKPADGGSGAVDVLLGSV